MTLRTPLCLIIIQPPFRFKTTPDSSMLSLRALLGSMDGCAGPRATLNTLATPLNRLAPPGLNPVNSFWTIVLPPNPSYLSIDSSCTTIPSSSIPCPAPVTKEIKETQEATDSFHSSAENLTLENWVTDSLLELMNPEEYLAFNLLVTLDTQYSEVPSSGS